LGDHTSSNSVQGGEVWVAERHRVELRQAFPRDHGWEPCCSIEASGATKLKPQQRCQDCDVSHWTGRYPPSGNISGWSTVQSQYQDKLGTTIRETLVSQCEGNAGCSTYPGISRNAPELMPVDAVGHVPSKAREPQKAFTGSGNDVPHDILKVA
jgi:hypothetical protein